MTARFDNCILSSLGFEMILCLVKRDAGALFEMPEYFLRKIDMPIQTCADSRPAERQFTQSFDRFFGARLRVSNLLGVPGKFLAEPDWGRIH